VPNNVRSSLQEAIGILQNTGVNNQEKVSCVISILDESSGDPNLSPYARTRMWNLISSLEAMMKN